MWVRPGRFLPGTARPGVTLGRLLEPSAAPAPAVSAPPPPPPPPPPAPALQISGVPTTGRVGVAAAGGTVTNIGTVTANWAVAAAAPDVTITPSSGTLVGGASAGFTLTATAIGARSISLTSSTPGAVISGSPMPFSGTDPMLGGSISGTVFFGLSNDVGSTARGAPLAQRNAMLALLTSHGVINFEEFSPGDAAQEFFAQPVGEPNMVTLAFTGADVTVRGAGSFGRYNTTSGGSRYIEPNPPNAATSFTVVPLDGSFAPVGALTADYNAFGIYLTDPGDFLPATYTFTVNTTEGVYSPLFDLASVMPTQSGCLVFWGFILSGSAKILSVTLALGSPTDVVGIDDIILGRT